ncbi:carbohydrate esterase family 5 protein [Teratosphaeria destructans]|uniref:Carbohydrate esterase family 5 protein n=1 Tax=Teratosphaeria destructans TaxID=418781 RepID=A0A9W7SSI8_9PEZI|nr:carbohydrate esterase family 5 protein [Teratosphaeria destructans]
MPSQRNVRLLSALSLLAGCAYAQSFGNYTGISNVSSSACPSPGGAHIIVARASVEPEGYGIIGEVKDRVLSAVPGSNAEFVVYPATLTNYVNSEDAGVTGMKALVDAYLAKDCGAPIVLMGYSQGAQVVTDYLSGQNDANFGYNASLTNAAPNSTRSHIAAVIVMGDPSINVTNNPFHVGNSTQSGIFSRHANSSTVLDSMASKLQSYCDALDPYCASAGNFTHLSVHLGYVQEYGTNATDFVARKVQEYYGNSTASSNPSASSTGSTTGSSSSETATAPAAYTGAASVLSLDSTAALAVALGGAFMCAS